MHLESTCIDMSAEKIQAILERSKPINYKWLISKIRKHLPELYSDCKNQVALMQQQKIQMHDYLITLKFRIELMKK